MNNYSPYRADAAASSDLDTVRIALSVLKHKDGCGDLAYYALKALERIEESWSMHEEGLYGKVSAESADVP